MSDPLYSICSVCQNSDSRVACPACEGRGFLPVGVTMQQVDRWGRWERWLNGDLGLPEADAKAAEVYILDRLRQLVFSGKNMAAGMAVRRAAQGIYLVCTAKAETSE